VTAASAEQTWTRQRVIVMTLAAVAILARSAIFLFRDQSYFDADQAVIGLMGKHLSELRAFPLFLYGQNYILAVEAWMAALSFKLFGVSIAALKLPLLVVNLVIAFLLVRTLVREARLTPALAGVASLFFIAAPPGTAAMLVEASGVNIEPFLYTLLIWLTRARPAWCGAIFAVGFMQREFTLYSLLSLALIAGLTGHLFTREAGRRALAGLRAAAEVWLVVTVAKQYSSAAGPGTSIADVRAPANNVLELLTRICFDQGTVGVGVWRLLSGHMTQIFGTRVEPLWQFAIDSNVTEGLPFAWVLVAGAMGLAAVRVAMWLAQKKQLPRETWFVAYLTAVGLTGAAAFVIARCGAQGHVRYALPTLFAAIGVGAWFLTVEHDRRLRTIWIVLVAAWASVSALSHAKLYAEYATHPPPGTKLMLVRHLQARGIKYAIADYWIAYYVSFVTKEQIIVMANDFPRILEYERLVNQHRGEAVLISRRPCGDVRPVVEGLYLCPP
jgi:hypothetical protein